MSDSVRIQASSQLSDNSREDTDTVETRVMELISAEGILTNEAPRSPVIIWGYAQITFFKSFHFIKILSDCYFSAFTLSKNRAGNDCFLKTQNNIEYLGLFVGEPNTQNGEPS